MQLQKDFEPIVQTESPTTQKMRNWFTPGPNSERNTCPSQITVFITVISGVWPSWAIRVISVDFRTDPFRKLLQKLVGYLKEKRLNETWYVFWCVHTSQRQTLQKRVQAEKYCRDATANLSQARPNILPQFFLTCCFL